MPKIISIHSFRGGTGKSNTTANLAVLVARAGRRVGVIDTDIHSPGIHVIFGLKDDAVRYALNDFLWGRCRIEEAAYEVGAAISAMTRGQESSPGLFLIPSSVKTGEIARVLREGYDVGLLTDGFRVDPRPRPRCPLHRYPPRGQRGNPALDCALGCPLADHAARQSGLPGDRRSPSSWRGGWM